VTSPQSNAGRAGDAAPSVPQLDARADLADRLLQGRGLLVRPVDATAPLPATATVREVDADGLKAAAVSSQDFIVDSGLTADGDPKAAIEARFAKLRPGGGLLCVLAEADLPAFLAARPANSEAEVAISAGATEVTVALLKAGPRNATVSGQQTPEVAAEVRELQAQVARLERELDTTSRELHRVKGSSSWRVTEPLRAAKARLGGRS
jgi:outer membrane murein-binding lipoprotein Lpp